MTDQLTPAPYENSTEEVFARFVEERVAHTVADLRHLADTIERRHREAIARLENGTLDGESPYGTLAGKVQHSITWGIANLGLDQLTRDAAAADQARARRLLGHVR